MARTKFLSLLCSATLLLAAPAILGSTGQINNFEVRTLAAHNRERAARGIAPMRWNPALAADARAWADRLAANGGFQHAPENESDPEGENLWAGTRGYFAIEAMVGDWAGEKRYFKPGIFPDNSTTGNADDVGHYTQMMWRNSRDIGCALATGRGDDVLVCRYSAAGNYEGERPF